MAATANQALTALGAQFAADGLDRGRLHRFGRRLEAWPRGDKPGQPAAFNARGGAALALAAALPWLALHEIGPGVSSLLALEPRGLSAPVPSFLEELLRLSAGGRPSAGLLPGLTLGSALEGLIEALAGPWGEALARALVTGGFGLQVSGFSQPIGLVATVSAVGTSQIYLPARLAADARVTSSRIVPSAMIGIDLFVAMAAQLDCAAEEEELAAA